MRSARRSTWIAVTMRRACSMRFMHILFGLLLTLLVATACNTTQQSVEVVDIGGEAWESAYDLRYMNSDTLALRDIAIVVRYGEGYVADSVAMSVLTISPDSLVFEEPFTLHIPHLAHMRPEEHTFIYRHNVLLKRKGEYTFRLTPSQRVEGIRSVGVVISEPEDKE